jgi:hypothetical protein
MFLDIWSSFFTERDYRELVTVGIGSIEGIQVWEKWVLVLARCSGRAV